VNAPPVDQQMPEASGECPFTSEHGTVLLASELQRTIAGCFLHTLAVRFAVRQTGRRAGVGAVSARAPRTNVFLACLVIAISQLASAAMSATTAARVHRVLHVCDCPSAMASAERAELLVAFSSLGYVHGGNLDLTTHDLAAGAGTYKAFFERQVAQVKPDLILASGIQVAWAARETNIEIPVIFWRLTDPVGQGLVTSLARPSGRLTGFSRGIEKLTVKRLELLHEMLPNARRVGFVFVSDNHSHKQQAADLEAFGQSLGLQLFKYSLPASRWSEKQSCCPTPMRNPQPLLRWSQNTASRPFTP
jgi:hypothetical protein